MCDECKALEDKLDAMFLTLTEARQTIEQLRTENHHLSNQYHRALFPLDPARVTPSMEQQIKARLKANPTKAKVKVSETHASIIMSCLRSRRFA